jgi:hypothetical protein
MVRRRCRTDSHSDRPVFCYFLPPDFLWSTRRVKQSQHAFRLGRTSLNGVDRGARLSGLKHEQSEDRHQPASEGEAVFFRSREVERLNEGVPSLI